MHARVLGFTLLTALAGTALADTPKKLFSETDDGADPAPTIKKIKAELAAADNGKARLLVLSAATTDSWGCMCPPFVYAPFAMGAPDNESPTYFFPIVKSGMDADDHHVGSGGGTYEFTGKLTGERIDAATWYSRRGKKAPNATGATADYRKKQPVFAVESWCFRKNDDAPDFYADQLAKLKKDGVPFCK